MQIGLPACGAAGPLGCTPDVFAAVSEWKDLLACVFAQDCLVACVSFFSLSVQVSYYFYFFAFLY